MTLSDILRPWRFPLEWHEAVALVRGVVGPLLEKSSGAIAPFPELEQIEIFAAGHVNVSGGTNVDEPVRRLGQLLQAMVAITPTRRFNSGSSSWNRPLPLLPRSARFANSTRPWGSTNDRAATPCSRVSTREPQ